MAFVLAEALWIRSLLCCKSLRSRGEYAKDVNACFFYLKQAYDRIPGDKFYEVLLQYNMDGQLLTAIKSLYTGLVKGGAGGYKVPGPVMF